ncbi:uncharacterized protein LOC112689056 isoform X1 [Sipha flava]|uniref:Uncharacterized protein LOC112689056 isoform X1 n=1 Tax=Sipha flava TaxID=143950 RepID=A0A8B8G611_9HEMI|nr:uncharacterized protein LOC112689056 isoform X1 [Sipha flava]
MESDKELEKMEDKMKSDLTYRKTVTELSRLMGQNLSETVRKIMQKLFSDTLLTFYSYIGFKGKKQFSTLQTCAVIFESIRRMKKFTDIANIEIEKPLKTWIA